ncbi:MAG TPA: MarR family transcriptional regulator [Prolixibacteraceae bacterium]|nr:MarR family transcriptional regulator [Prolixibacteraceae bacterium]
MAYEQLKLENQLCFPVYAASRLITREYQPFLEKLGITYPQYLVLMVLWEKDGLPVNDIAKKLILNTNTITPLLKRMEQQGLLIRKRSEKDERIVLVHLSEKGIQLKTEAARIPDELIKHLSDSELKYDDLVKLKESLIAIIAFLSSDRATNPDLDPLV